MSGYRLGAEGPRWELCLVLLLLLSRCGWVQAPGTCHQLSVTDGFAGELTSSGGHFDPTSEATAQECATVCGQLGVAYSAVETMDVEMGTLACLCAPDEEFQTVTVSSADCTACQDSTCGGVDGVVYVSPSAEDLAELTMTVSPDGTTIKVGEAVTITATTDVDDVEFTIQVGDRSPPFNVSGSDVEGAATLTQDVSYYSPGDFTLSVTAQKRGGSTILSRQATVNVMRVATLLEARCPPVQEPNLPYHCGAVVAGNDAEVTATFSNGAESTSQLPNSPVMLLGTAPPQGSVNGGTELVTPLETFLVQPPFATTARLLSVRTFGLTTGSCSGELVTPSCTAPDVFCADAGVCSSSCAQVPETAAEFQCSTGGTFCALTGLCAAGTVSEGDCGVLGTAASFSGKGDTFPISVTEGQHTSQDITAEVIAQPGDMLQITCEGGAHVAAIAASHGGDTGSASDKLHLLQVTAAPMHQFSWENTCTTPVETVTFTAALPEGTSVTNSTSCEYIISNITISLMQGDSEMLPDSPEDPIYLSTALPVMVRMQMLEGAPVLMNWDYGTTDLDNGTQELLERVDTTAYYSQTVTYPEPGTFTINASATNKHSETLGATWVTQEVILQNPVLDAWTVEINTTQILIMRDDDTGTMVEFVLKLPVTERLPTDATVLVNYGHPFMEGKEMPLIGYRPIDGNPTTKDGFYIFPMKHAYAEARLYDVNITLKNEISSYTLQTQVDVEEKICNFSVQMKFENTAGALTDGLGDDKNEYHNDKNITFLMSMTQGTVTRYELYNTSSGEEELLETFAVVNKLKPTEGIFFYFFSENQELNITFKAFNSYEESDAVEATIWIKDPITPINSVQILEDGITAKLQSKSITIAFDCASTHSLCLAIDYGDVYEDPDTKTIPVIAVYGDEAVCKAKYPTADIQPSDLKIPMTVNHTYWHNTKYTLTATLFNPVSLVTADLTFLVVPFSCEKPIITVTGASPVKETAVGYSRSKAITVETETVIPNCKVEFTSIRRWVVSKIDPLTGKTLEQVPTENVLPSWNKSSLLIQKKFLELDFALYKLDFILQLYEGEEPPELPYEVMSTSYVEVKRSPLVAIMVPGSVSRLVRGWGQMASLDPGTNSIDPDLPEDKNFECEWYCRLLTEEFPMNDTHILDNPLLPVRQLGDPAPTTSSGGCFGHGPGRLDFHSCQWDINTNIFHPVGQDITFHLVVFVKKNGRTANTFIDLEMVSGKPPMMTIKCVSPKLCSPTEGGVFVNPENRLGLIGNCTHDCFPPLTYEWTVSMVSSSSDDPIPVEDVDKYIMSEPNTKYLSLSKTIFSNYSNIEKFHVSLKSKNSHPSQKTGAATFYVIRNKPPNVKDALCSTNISCHKALICTMDIQCQPPKDPEGHAIGEYSFMTKIVNEDTVDNPVWKTIAKVPKPIINLRFAYGKITVYYKVTDTLGSSVLKEVTTIVSLMPDKKEYDEFINGPIFKSAVALKKTREMAIITVAMGSIRSYAPWNAPGYVQPGVDPADAAAALSEQNSNVLKAIGDFALDGLAAIDTAASSMSSTLGSVIGSKENSLNLDSESTSISVNVAAAILSGTEESDPSTPEELEAGYSGIITVLGAATTTSAIIAADEECKSVPELDKKKAPKLEYDTRITNFLQPVDNTDIQKQQACNVRAVSMASSADNSETFSMMQEKMKFLALKRMVPGEEQNVKSDSGVVMKNKIMKNMTGAALDVGGSKVQTPTDFCPTGDCDDPVGTSLSVFPRNTKSSAGGAEALSKDTKIVSMEVTRGDGSDNVRVANLSNPIVITIEKPVMNMSSDPNCTDCIPGPSSIDPSVALQGKRVPLIYSQFSIPRPDSTFNVEIYLPGDAPHRLFVMISIEKQPTLKSHDMFKMVEDFPVITDAPPEVDASKKYDWFVGVELVNNRTGRAFVAVGELKDDLDLEATKQKLDTNETIEDARAKDLLAKNFSTPYFMRTFISGCFYYDEVLNIWTSSGLKCVGANADTTSCETGHLSMFGSGLVVEPNTIDFAYVFANASFADNLTIYMTMIVSLGLYFILAIWSRWQDKKDVEKVGARPMPDNAEADRYLYEVMVFTGHKSDAATDSAVSMVLVGDKDETPARTFGKPKRRFFRKGGQDAFVMACPRPLGDLLHLRVWHDNSGSGRYSSWYLQYIHIRDVQTGKHYDFVGDRWLAVEENDGKIDALIPVAGKEQLGQFSHVFSHTSQQNLADGHLWFSIFLRPPRSRFTRVQRVSCCFALLFLSMMVNAMWYGVVPSTPSSGALNFGPMSLSIEQISVGVMSNLIIFPPSFLIVFLFKKSRARKLRKSRIDEALEKQKFGNQVAKSERPVSANNQSKDGEDDDKNKKKKKKPLLLPWWCRIIAWILCIICLFGSAFIVWAYGVQFGNEKTTKWLTSLLTSFFSSILIIQPLKVFLIAIVISSIFKSIDLDGDDADEDELHPTLASDEEWIYNKPRKRRSKHSGVPDIYDQETLGRMRKNRLNEVQMWRIIREIVSYGFFLYILIILSFDNRDPNSFYLRANLEAAFIKEADLTNGKTDLDFTKVHDAGTFWTWAQNVVMQELRAQNWYDHVSPPYGLKGFLDDRVNRIMGYGMIRQIRSKPNTCRIHSRFADSFKNCAGLSGLFDEETGHYCANWTRTGSRKDCNRGEYRYKTADELDGLPYIGSLDVYGGGGYVYKLTGRMGNIAKKMQQLREEAWIDHMTRAVLVEFSVYNSQVNLFGIATIFAEAVPGGGLLPGWRFDGVRLIRHHAGFQLFVFICELIYMLFIIYFMVREIRDLVKQKRDYFRSYWVYSEISIILLSWAAFIVYIMRYIETDTILKNFKKTYGNGFVKMQYAQTLDDVFGYLLGMLVFIATIKFSKLLRFNRRIGMLSATLKQCWGDLTGFFLIFFIALGTFAMVFHLLLLTHMDDFKNMMSATESAFAMLLNKFDFEGMRKGSLLAVVLFLFFAITMSIFFVNVLLTIIIRAFQQVKDDVLKQPNDFEILEFIQLRMFRFVGVGQRRVEPLHEHVKQFQTDQRRKSNQQKQVDQLPTKMDQFLSQVNDMYFDGQLELNNKEFLKKTLASKKKR